MRIHSMIGKTTHFLRRPFLQRLILLIVSTLLAMSLACTAFVIALPTSRGEGVVPLPAIVTPLDTVKSQHVPFPTQRNRPTLAPGGAQRGENRDATRRQP